MTTEAAKTEKRIATIDIPGFRKELKELLDSNPSTDEIGTFFSDNDDALMLAILQLIAK